MGDAGPHYTDSSGGFSLGVPSRRTGTTPASGSTVLPYIPQTGVSPTAEADSCARMEALLQNMASHQQMMQFQMNQFIMMQEQHNKRTSDQLSLLTQAVEALMQTNPPAQRPRQQQQQQQPLPDAHLPPLGASRPSAAAPASQHPPVQPARVPLPAAPPAAQRAAADVDAAAAVAEPSHDPQRALSFSVGTIESALVADTSALSQTDAPQPSQNASATLPGDSEGAADVSTETAAAVAAVSDRQSNSALSFGRSAQFSPKKRAHETSVLSSHSYISSSSARVVSGFRDAAAAASVPPHSVLDGISDAVKRGTTAAPAASAAAAAVDKRAPATTSGKASEAPAFYADTRPKRGVAEVASAASRPDVDASHGHIDSEDNYSPDTREFMEEWGLLGDV
eukprot:Rhum_TRINITY_DN9316_c0_g2::Rhum_TRINITY_DN9316_c0_g2_i1::g.32912::m.32912